MKENRADLSDKISSYICDVSDCDAVQAVAEKVREEVSISQEIDSPQVGDPTILINNAGVVKGKLLLDLTKEDVEKCVSYVESD